MKSGFAGKTALVTGGCGGLGLAISQAFLDAGANVVACDVKVDFVKDFQATGDSSFLGKLLSCECDITNAESLEKLFKTAVEKFKHIDIVINNAGIVDRFDPVGTLEKSVWDRVIAINLTAPYAVSKLAVSHFLENDIKGVIINIASIAGTRGYAAGAAYVASKHGLIGLTKNTASFYMPKGIRCNAVCPGGMETHITDNLRNGYNEEGLKVMQRQIDMSYGNAKLEQVASTVLYLCSEQGGAINGACLPTDLGWVL